MAWRFLVSGPLPPSLNMAIDYALWKAAGTGQNPPTLRFYTWKPSAVSLGYNQSPDEVVNMDFCRKENIPVVRRPTGGSAIFHDWELTYSFSAHADSFPDFSGPVASYLSVCQALQKGLQELGLNPELRGYSEGKEPSYTNQACFVLSSRHDLVFKNKKIVGSAQRRNKHSFLQHGSILIGLKQPLWEKIFVNAPEFEKIGCLQEFLSVPVSAESLTAPLKKGFAEHFGTQFMETELTPEEAENAGRFAEKHFACL